jgi:hypothetical protein
LEIHSVADKKLFLGLRFSIFFSAWLLYELGFSSLESFLAGHAAKIVGFAFIRDFVFGCAFIQNHAANWIPEHLF